MGGGGPVSALRLELYAAVDRIIDALEKAPRPDDWIDQEHSPLGKAKHIEKVRTGEIPGVRDGKQYLVRRSDLDAYLAKRKGDVRPLKSGAVAAAEEAAGREARAARIAAGIGKKK